MDGLTRHEFEIMISLISLTNVFLHVASTIVIRKNQNRIGVLERDGRVVKTELNKVCDDCLPEGMKW